MTECTCIKCYEKRTEEFIKLWSQGPQNNGFIMLDPDYPKYQYACHKCGNKRCPHHKDHRFKCTNSNEPDQVGVLIEEDSKMKIEVVEIKDREDGSADLVMDMSKEALHLFAAKGIVDTLREQLGHLEEEHRDNDEDETDYLLRSPANVESLTKSIKSFDTLSSSIKKYTVESLYRGNVVIGPGVNKTFENLDLAKEFAALLDAAYIMGWNDRGNK